MNLNQKVINLLKKIGLSYTEAKFFTVLNNNPWIQIAEIQKKIGLSRASVYRIYDSLKDKGLIVQSSNEYAKKFKCVSLLTLAEKISKEQRKLRRVELELKSIDNLFDLSKDSFLEDPIEIITDQDMISEQAYKILGKSWDNFLCYGSAERLFDVMTEEVELDFVKKRYQMGKKTTVILTEIGEYAKYFLPNNHRDLRETKIGIDKNNQDYCIYMYDDEVTIWHKHKELGVRAIVTRDPILCKSYANMFKNIWERV